MGVIVLVNSSKVLGVVLPVLKDRLVKVSKVNTTKWKDEKWYGAQANVCLQTRDECRDPGEASGAREQLV